MSKYPSIPDFVSSLDSMSVALRAVKTVLEQMTSGRQGRATVALVFVQAYAPTEIQNPSYGDIWINSETNALKWWNGVEWLATT